MNNKFGREERNRNDFEHQDRNDRDRPWQDQDRPWQDQDGELGGGQPGRDRDPLNRDQQDRNWESEGGASRQRFPGSYGAGYGSLGTRENYGAGNYGVTSGSSGGYGSGTSTGARARSYGGLSSTGDRSSFSGRGPKGYTRTDDRIREDVCDRLSQDDGVDASEIEVRVEAGEVILEGTVQTRSMKHQAEDIAESVQGVKDVRNNVRVTKPILTELKDKIMGTDAPEHHANSGTKNTPASTSSRP